MLRTDSETPAIASDTARNEIGAHNTRLGSRARPKLMRKPVKIAAVLVVAAIASAVGLVTALGIGADWRAYTVQGGSMQPHYGQGDLIVTTSADARKVQPGQIIVFTADWASERYQRRVVHRVSAVGTIDGLPIAYTRGDANSIADPRPVDLTGDVRIVSFSLPAGGFWLDLLTRPLAIGIFATLAVAMVGVVIATGMPLLKPGFRQSVSRQPVPVRPIRETGRGQLSGTLPAADLRSIS